MSVQALQDVLCETLRGRALSLLCVRLLIELGQGFVLVIERGLRLRLNRIWDLGRVSERSVGKSDLNRL